MGSDPMKPLIHRASRSGSTSQGKTVAGGAPISMRDSMRGVVSPQVRSATGIAISVWFKRPSGSIRVV